MTVPQARRAARVLLLDARDRVLLFQGRDPVHAHRGQWWFTPGGGLDAGETPAQGAARELREETGLVVDPAALGEAIHHRVTTFPWGDVVYEQSEDYFVLRVDSHVVDTSGFDDVETAAVIGHRWWDRSDLAATCERYYPRELLELLP
ncbi:MAG: hydrolase [Frankiales bacterium]|nr:hydrolase [Frankiales bacterium]